jgi:FixJ family two-component response regulator
MDEATTAKQLISLSGRHQNIKPASEIFVADDDEYIREVLTLVLSMDGLSVIGFTDGNALLKRVRERTPVCIFLDVIMPGHSGIHILKELNSLQFKAPVYLMSARDDTSIVVEGIKYGAHDFLRKPFDPYAAVQRVRDAIELWSTRNEKTSVAGFETKVPSDVRLTRRETEVLTQVVLGKCSKDIAKSLGIAKRTVDFFRMGLLRKLGAKNTRELVHIVTSGVDCRPLTGPASDHVR